MDDKVIDRETLRGEPLDKDCYNAYRTTHEYGPEDTRVFCLGLYAYDKKNMELSDKCKKCLAYVDNSTPLDIKSKLSNVEKLNKILKREGKQRELNVYGKELKVDLENYNNLRNLESSIGCPLDVYVKVREGIFNVDGCAENVVFVYTDEFKTYNPSTKKYNVYKYSDYKIKWWLSYDKKD